MTPDNRPVSWGYNGPPASIQDTPERLNDRRIKYALTIHAELNAIPFAERSQLIGASIFVYPLPPCSNCAAAIVQNRLARVVSIAPGPGILDRWGESLALANEIFTEAGVRLELYEMRDFHGL
jgi:dCMP deaminase